MPFSVIPVNPLNPDQLERLYDLLLFSPYGAFPFHISNSEENGLENLNYSFSDGSSNNSTRENVLFNFNVILSFLSYLQDASDLGEDYTGLLYSLVNSTVLLDNDFMESHDLIPIDELIVETNGSISPASYARILNVKPPPSLVGSNNTEEIIKYLRVPIAQLNDLKNGTLNNIKVELMSGKPESSVVVKFDVNSGKLLMGVSDFYSDVIENETLNLASNSLNRLNIQSQKLDSIYSEIVKSNGQLEFEKEETPSIEQIEESLRITKNFFDSDSSFSALVKEMKSDILPLLSTLESKSQVKVNIDSKLSLNILDLDIIKDLIKRMNNLVMNIVDLKQFIDKTNSEIYENPESREKFSDLFLGLPSDGKVNVLSKYNKLCSLYSSESTMLIKGVNLLASLSPLISGELFGIVDVSSLTDDTYIETAFINSPDVSYLLDPNISSPTNKGQFAITFNPMYGIINYFDCLTVDSNASRLFDSISVINVKSKALIDNREQSVFMKYFQEGDFFNNVNPLGNATVNPLSRVKKVFKPFFKFGGAVTFALDIAKILLIVFTLDSLARISNKLYVEVKRCISGETSFIECILKIEFGKVLSDSLSEALGDTRSFVEKAIGALSDIAKWITSGIWSAIPLPLKIVIGGGLGFGIYRLVSSYAKKDEDDE